MEAVAGAAAGGVNTAASGAAANIDLSMFVRGSESGATVPLSALSSLGLDQAWKSDPRALWSSFAMIIVRPISNLLFRPCFFSSPKLS